MEFYTQLDNKKNAAYTELEHEAPVDSFIGTCIDVPHSVKD